MLILLIAYLGGLLTILSPCILPVLPFVFARADRPFRSHGLPVLSGMALAFAATATLAAVGGGWAISLSEYGRHAALAILGLFGVGLLFPAVADRWSRPLIVLGNRLSQSQTGSANSTRGSVLSSLFLGASTGMLWAPCAGPILGLILTSAAINGASAGTSFLLLSFAAGACTSLAAALLFGGRLASMMKQTLHVAEWLRRAAGWAVLLGVGTIALGLDTGLLTRLSIGSTSAIEQDLVEAINGRQPLVPRNDDVGLMPFVAVRDTAPPPAHPLGIEGHLPSLGGASEWINSPPLTTEGLRGKVVLIDFWTYSCINCLRTIPYLRAWAEKYKDAGLVIIGVHAPEFAFEKRVANVRRATKDLGIDFPVAIDNNFAVWRAFDNHYWPAFYFVDAQGRIRHHQFGESQYDQSEQIIRQLLAETGPVALSPGLVAPQGQGTQAAPGRAPPLSQETYLGYARESSFASPGGVARDRAHVYRAAASLRTDAWALSGEWTVGPESIVASRANGRIAYRFAARDLHLVLGPAVDGRPQRFKVFIDGKPPLADHGADIDAEGNGAIVAQRLYQLVRQTGEGPARLFEIEFAEPGAQAWVFTFG